jgi:hypothetical protein
MLAERPRKDEGALQQVQRKREAKTQAETARERPAESGADMPRAQ